MPLNLSLPLAKLNSLAEGADVPRCESCAAALDVNDIEPAKLQPCFVSFEAGWPDGKICFAEMTCPHCGATTGIDKDKFIAAEKWEKAKRANGLLDRGPIRR